MQEGSKIAFVMPWHISERGGGAEVQANYLAQELAKRGYLVSYICQTTNAAKINTNKKIGGIKAYFLKPSGRFQWHDQNKYLKPLQAFQPDYILQRLSSNVTYVLGKYSSDNNCKLIWFCTDNKSPFSDFHTAKFKERYTLKSLGVIKYMIFALSNILMDYYRNKGMKHVDIAFTQNDFQQNELKNNFGLQSHRMISGHPVPTKKNSILQRFSNKTVLWCGNFGAHKRPELFIELASKMQHTNITFVMVGGHSDVNYVTQLLADKPNNLITTGQLNFEEALLYFNDASILVNTSISEGFSNTYIQAWLRGIPTLVFGADPDNTIQTNNLGFNVSQINDALMYIEDVLSSQSEYESLSLNTYNYAAENHSIKKMTDNFLQAIPCT